MTDNNNNDKVSVNLLFFAKLRELTNLNAVEFELPKQTTGEILLNIICEKYKNIEILRNNLIIAINENYCPDSQEIINIKNGDEIALIPPISGG